MATGETEEILLEKDIPGFNASGWDSGDLGSVFSAAMDSLCDL